MNEENPDRWRILTAVLVGTFMGPLDASIVYIALPAIGQVFGADPAATGWISMSYLLVLGSFLLAFGRLGDMFGFKRIYLYGLIIFSVTSVLCGLAVNLPMLIVFRALQAVGAGMSTSIGPAIITAAFPPTERGRALGMNGMVVALGLATGPTLGGFLVDVGGWRSIFFINLPIGLGACLWAIKALPEVLVKTRNSFDWKGALLAFSSLMSLLIFASRIQVTGRSWPVFILGLTGILLGIYFVHIEKQVDEPMLDLSLFKNRVFSYGNTAALLNFMTQYIIVFLTPFFLQQILSYRAFKAGVTMTAFPLTVLVTAPLAGAVSDKIGQRGLAFAGSFLCTVAAGLLAMLDQHAGPADIAWRLGVFGLGTGLFQSPNNSAIMNSVPGNRLGIASGVLSTYRNIGMVFGIAAGGTVLSVRRAFYLTQDHHFAFLLGIKDAYFTAMLISSVATIVCLFCVSKRTE